VFEVFIAGDNGVNGAMVVGRIGTSGIEILAPPFVWWHRRTPKYDLHKEEIFDRLRFWIQEYRPRFLAMEQAKVHKGRRLVVVSQAWKGAELALVASQCPNPPELMMVPGQGWKRTDEGWAILRSSFAEIVSRDELRELGGPKGENVRDCCAILVRAEAQWDEMRRKMRDARAQG